MSEYDDREPYAEDGTGHSAPAKQTPEKIPKMPERKQLPPWRVILHNDNINELDDVVESIHKVTPLTKQDARIRTMEAHSTGSALLLITHQERAELYVEQLASCKLTATAEADA